MTATCTFSAPPPGRLELDERRGDEGRSDSGEGISPIQPYISLTIYLGLAGALALALVAISGRLSPKAPSAAKLQPYECGISEPTPTEARWPVRFALVAMLFLVFDVEALFLYPWAVLMRELRWEGIAVVASFFIILGVGYVYARSRGALQWR